jgi:hypothetical protein
LFFNGNTFADIGRTFADFLFAELPAIRRRQVTSAIAHYIAGVLEREPMTELVESMWFSADLHPGDRIKTLRGSLHGTVVRLGENGVVTWRPDGSELNLTCSGDGLLRETPRTATREDVSSDPERDLPCEPHAPRSSRDETSRNGCGGIADQRAATIMTSQSSKALSKEKDREEKKRDRAYDRAERWRAIQRMIAWAEQQLPSEQRRNRPRVRSS